MREVAASHVATRIVARKGPCQFTSSSFIRIEANTSGIDLDAPFVRPWQSLAAMRLAASRPPARPPHSSPPSPPSHARFPAGPVLGATGLRGRAWPTRTRGHERAPELISLRGHLSRGMLPGLNAQEAVIFNSAPTGDATLKGHPSSPGGRATKGNSGVALIENNAVLCVSPIGLVMAPAGLLPAPPGQAGRCHANPCRIPRARSPRRFSLCYVRRALGKGMWLATLVSWLWQVNAAASSVALTRSVLQAVPLVAHAPCRSCPAASAVPQAPRHRQRVPLRH